MTVTQLPAHNTVTAATEVAVTDHTVTVIDADQIHRDKRQTIVNAAAIGAAVTGAPAVGLIAAGIDTPGKALTVVSALLSATALGFYNEIRRENRRWVLTTDVDTP